MPLLQELRARIKYKIIIPFLLLTLLVALAGAGVTVFFMTSSAQERLNNQLAQAARVAGDGIARQESLNLALLREMAFAGTNPSTGAPAVASAVASGDAAGLTAALEPYVRISAERGVRLDRLIVFDRSGAAMLEWTDDGAGGYAAAATGRQLGHLWFTEPILGARADALGDKYAGLLELGDARAQRYLFTAVPIAQGDTVVGGLVLAIDLDVLLQEIAARSQAALVTLYDPATGQAFAGSSAVFGDLRALDLPPALLPAFSDLQAARERGVFDVVQLNQRTYQVAYAPLDIRSSTVALIGVGLATDYVIGSWAEARAPLVGLTLLLMGMIIALGVLISRRITMPLTELVTTAQAVMAGDLARRSQVRARDEVGQLSASFNSMTAHLLELYHAVRAEASQRAAILESIADGVVMCAEDGRVLLVNGAARTLLGLGPEDPGPQRFDEIALRPLGSDAPNFGQTRLDNLFHLGESIVRLAVAPVHIEDGTRLGSVYVLQDVTSQVTIDRAKTNFIATISHELRTPLTVLGGNADLLLRGFVGPLTPEQTGLLEAMRSHTQSMTALINNVIVIAGLDAGTLTSQPEPVELAAAVDSALWGVRRAASAAGLTIDVDLPPDLPEARADLHMLRIVLQQLLDNACRYTAAGGVRVRAEAGGDRIALDVIDTGCGIAPELAGQLFERFTRGEAGINSDKRGIGLGLAIARELLERQGGTIELAETSEHGSRFRITLPLAASAEAPEEVDAHAV